MKTVPPTEAAEEILHRLQQALAGIAHDLTDRSREAMRKTEQAYGAQATRDGRRLHELTCDSYAWDLFERRRRLKPHLPHMHELCQCEPLLHLMRASGELADRERLLRERDAALVALWQSEFVTDSDRWLDAEDVQDEYFSEVRRVAETYRPHYAALQIAAGRDQPLDGPRVRSRPLLQPPLMSLIFGACHDTWEGEVYCQGRNVLRLPSAGRADIPLDAMAWDIAVLAVSAFHVRTDGNDPDAPFPFLIDDYFQWRGLDPRKRSPVLRQQIVARLEMLCSETVQIHAETDLWLPDPHSGRRRKTPVMTTGPLLIKRAQFFARPPKPGETGQDAADGFLLSLGEWARAFVRERTMQGICLRRLAEYDLQRQQWERRIGWYLAFQMHNQASRMTFEEVVRDGRTRTAVTPQHPLRMRTVLDHSYVGWREMARTNPGKVIRQWCDALETLHRDGVIGSVRCLDGAWDGSDLPIRGRLNILLERRFRIVPGRDLLPHVRAKGKMRLVRELSSASLK